jgi:hypothetical protein
MLVNIFSSCVFNIHDDLNRTSRQSDQHSCFALAVIGSDPGPGPAILTEGFIGPPHVYRQMLRQSELLTPSLNKYMDKVMIV